MTKTCPHCHATVISTSQPNLMGTTTDIAQELAQQIPDNNDMITMQMHVSKRAAVLAALAATPAVGGELEALKNLYNEIAGTWSAFEYGIRAEISNTNYACVQLRLDEAKAVLAAPPASPLRGRDSVLLKWQEKLADLKDMKARGDLTPQWGESSLISAQTIVDDLTASASPPEQPAAVRCDRCGSSGDVFMMCAGCQSPLEQPAAVKMYRDALAAANARIAELEDRLSKATFTQSQ